MVYSIVNTINDLHQFTYEDMDYLNVINDLHPCWNYVDQNTSLAIC